MLRSSEKARDDETVRLDGGDERGFPNEWKDYLDHDVEGRGIVWWTALAPAFMLLVILGGTAATFGCWLFRRVTASG